MHRWTPLLIGDDAELENPGRKLKSLGAIELTHHQDPGIFIGTHPRNLDAQRPLKRRYYTQFGK